MWNVEDQLSTIEEQLHLMNVSNKSKQKCSVLLCLDNEVLLCSIGQTRSRNGYSPLCIIPYLYVYARRGGPIGKAQASHAVSQLVGRSVVGALHPCSI